jgi:hypothetical protein
MLMEATPFGEEVACEPPPDVVDTTSGVACNHPATNHF